ncbi:MAG: hypothetical protein RLZ86_969, partial [Actinomycetota bacterium]
DVLLDGAGNAVQRTDRFARSSHCVGAIGIGSRSIVETMNDRVQSRIDVVAT